MPPKATTLSEAQAQQLTIPEFSQWRKFAGTLNGYSIFEELGREQNQWYPEKRAKWEASNTWELDLIDLRLMLFFVFRQDYFTGYTYDEQDEIVDSLLDAISKKLDQPYQRKFPQQE